MWVGALPDARRRAFQIRVPPPRSPQVHFPSQLDVVACERGAVPVLHCGSTEVAGTGTAPAASTTAPPVKPPTPLPGPPTYSLGGGTGITASSSAAASDQKGDRHLLVADTAAYIMSRDREVAGQLASYFTAGRRGGCGRVTHTGNAYGSGIRLGHTATRSSSTATFLHS